MKTAFRIDKKNLLLSFKEEEEISDRLVVFVKATREGFKEIAPCEYSKAFNNSQELREYLEKSEIVKFQENDIIYLVDLFDEQN